MYILISELVVCRYNRPSRQTKSFPQHGSCIENQQEQLVYEYHFFVILFVRKAEKGGRAVCMICGITVSRLDIK